MDFKPGLEGVTAVKTALSKVDGEAGRLIFRGYEADELARKHQFEEAVHLLWYGTMPTDDELSKLKEELKKNRKVPEKIVTLIKELPEDMEMMAVLRTCISALGYDTEWPPKPEEAIRITAITPTILTYRYRLMNNQEVVSPNNDLDHVANYLYMLRGEEPTKDHTDALNAYFILTAEHGLNAATFTSRVITSTQSDMFSAITGAIGAMKGPLHGGAPSGVMDMLDEIGSMDHVESWIRKKLENDEKLMGFGHRVYKTMDPRSEALRDITSKMSENDEWLALAKQVEKRAIELLEEYKPGRRLYTNVEFYAAAIFRSIDFPSPLFTPTFTASRMAGWCAHIMEQGNNNRIFRPLAAYTGDE